MPPQRLEMCGFRRQDCFLPPLASVQRGLTWILSSRGAPAVGRTGSVRLRGANCEPIVLCSRTPDHFSFMQPYDGTAL